MRVPEPTRPSLSGYVTPGKLLPWAWVDARMSKSRNYWITTRTTAFPSSRPVWGIWRDTRLFFSSGSLIARHVDADPRVQVNLESGDELVILEGLARPMPASELDAWLDAYKAKYHWDMPASVDGVYEVRAHRVLAWMCDSSGIDAGALFANTATEWRFADAEGSTGEAV